MPRLGTRFVSQADGKRTQPSQGEGREQIVVESKQELTFEIVQGSQGGAAERGTSPALPTDPPSHFVQIRYWDQKRAFVMSASPSKADSRLQSRNVRFVPIA